MKSESSNEIKLTEDSENIKEKQSNIKSGEAEHRFIYSSEYLDKRALEKRKGKEIQETGYTSKPGDWKKIAWDAFDKDYTVLIPPPSPAGRVTRIVRNGSERFNPKNEELYKESLKWDDFKTRATERERLKWIDSHVQPDIDYLDKHLEDAKSPLNDEPTLGSEATKKYKTFKKNAEAARNRVDPKKDKTTSSSETVLSKDDSYRSMGAYKNWAENIRGMAHQLREYVQWHKNVDQEQQEMEQFLSQDHKWFIKMGVQYPEGIDSRQLSEKYKTLYQDAIDNINVLRKVPETEDITVDDWKDFRQEYSELAGIEVTASEKRLSSGIVLSILGGIKGRSYCLIATGASIPEFQLSSFEQVVNCLLLISSKAWRLNRNGRKVVSI
jgi:hypothetical protein